VAAEAAAAFEFGASHAAGKAEKFLRRADGFSRSMRDVAGLLQVAFLFQ
jgi:hypothetical protein